jgi:hypothetical protein
MQRHTYLLYGTPARSQGTSFRGRDQPHEDRVGEEFGCGITAGEFRDLVEVAIVQLRQHLSHVLGCATDVNDNPVGIDCPTLELDIDDIRSAMQPLRGSKDFTPEAVRDHDVIAYCHAKHPGSFDCGSG